LKNVPDGTRLFRVPELLANSLKTSLGGAIKVKETRGHWDYLYRLNDLATLPGNRFHKKKNLVNQFKKKYEVIYKV